MSARKPDAYGICSYWIMTAISSVGLVLIFAFFTPFLCAGVVCIEGEDYYDGPSNSLEAIGQKPTASGGECLYGYRFGASGRLTRYPVSLGDDMSDASLIVRYSRMHWYESQVDAEIKLTLSSRDTLVTRQLLLKPTGGWATYNSAHWDIAEVELGELASGDYMLRLESLNDSDGDINIDFMLVTDRGDINLELLKSCTRVDVNAARAAGISFDRRWITDKNEYRLELPVIAFDGKYEADVAVSIAGAETSSQIYSNHFSARPDAPVRLSFIADEFKMLPDGKYHLLCKFSDAETLEIPFIVARDFASELSGKISAIEDFYSTRILTGELPKSDRYNADFALAIKYLKGVQEKIANGTGGVELIADARATISQYLQCAEALEKNHYPYIKPRDDLRFALKLAQGEDSEPANCRMFIPDSYEHYGSVPCIVTIADSVDMYMDMAGGALRELANRRGWAVIAIENGGNWDDESTRLPELIAAACKRMPGIDTGRLFGIGNAYYGFRAYSLSVDNPALFAAIACVNGVGDRVIKDEKWSWRSKITDTPVIIIQGGLDNITPPRWARIIANAHKSRQLDYDLRVFPSYGHGLKRYANEYFELIFNFFDRYQIKIKGDEKILDDNTSNKVTLDEN